MLFTVWLGAWADGPNYGTRTGYWHEPAYRGSEPQKSTFGYIISDAGNLAYVSYAVKEGIGDYKTATLILANDIDMSAHYWDPMKNWKGSLNGNGHTIKNLYAYNASKNCGFVGYTEDNSVITIENVTFKNCYSQGENNSGIVMGNIDYGSTVTFSNVRLEECGLSSERWNNAGGFVGYVESSSEVTFQNCYSDVNVHSNTKVNVGGYIGKSDGGRSVILTFDNCVTKLTGNGYFTVREECNDRGGFIGYVKDKARVRFNNVAVIGDTKSSSVKDRRYGALVGGFENDGGNNPDVQAMNSFISKDVNLPTGTLRDTYQYAFGATINSTLQSYLNPHSSYSYIIPNAAGNMQFKAAYQANKLGGRFGYNGSYIVPCSDSKHSIVGFTNGNLLSSVTGGNIDNGIIGDKYAYMQCQDTMTYTVIEDGNKWVFSDETNDDVMHAKKRLGKWTFQGVPQKDGNLVFKMLQRPVFNWDAPSFNAIQLTVNLKWSSDQDTDLSNYWAKQGGKICIYRNGECVDSVSCNVKSWEDKNPLYASVNKYELRFVCPNLFFDESDNVSTLEWETNAEWDGRLNLNLSGSTGNLKLNVPMPNSKALDGGKVVLYKLVVSPDNNVDVTSEETLEEKGNIIGEDVFHYTQGAGNYVQMNFYDKTTSVPCSKWVYQAVAKEFTDSVYKDKKALTSMVSYVDPTLLNIQSFTTSKGASTDNIKVEWKTENSKPGTLVRYELSRVQYQRGVDYNGLIDGTIDADWKTVYTSDNSNAVNVYNDPVLPGYVYIYRLRAYAACDGTYQKNVFSTASDIGYAASRGTIMGSIVYGSGPTAVEGVDVRLTADDNSLESKADVFALMFRGRTDCLPLADNLPAKFWDSDWTLNFLLRPHGDDVDARVATVLGKWALNINKRTLTLGSATLELPLVSDYSFVMLRHDSNAKKLYLGYATAADQGENESVWCDAVADAEAAKWLADNAVADSLHRVDDGVLVFGQATMNDVPFSGRLDEVRLWSKQLSDDEISKTYNRYLTGNETSLEAYYTFDAGVAEFAFDNSHPEGLWNNRNVRLPEVDYPRIVNDVVPSARNLSYRGTTDKNGEYQISGVPYTGEGTNYQVVPVFGTHEFKPASTRRFVSAQSLSHTSVNFTDQSSFRVPVQAYYVYGNIPAEGLNVSVDGILQMDDDNNYIATDADGKAVVSVPIGRHRLALVGSKHTMVNKGYPTSITSVSDDGKCTFSSLADRQGYIDFQADYTAAATFYDSTFVRVVGRVAGGKDEEAKPIGFAKSVGNLGQAELVIAPSLTKTYMVNNGDFDITPSDTIETIKSTLVFPAKSTSVTVKTDPATGEFTALLPPINWEVKSVRSVKDGMSDFGDLSSYVNKFKLDPVVEAADTLWNDSLTTKDPTKTDTYKTFKYNVSHKYTLYNKPEMTLVNLNAPEGYESMLGEQYALMQYLDEKTLTAVDDTVCLWNKAKHDGSAESYAMGMPVFLTGDNYRMQIRIFEKYKNHDNDSISSVPVRGANVTVYNRWSNLFLQKLNTGDYTLNAEYVDTAQVVTGEKDNPGTVGYSFIAGVPNPTVGDFSLPMTISYTVNGVNYSESYNGYVMGVISRGGSNFVTEAPKEVFGVLFDPPGSNSSAFMETGMTMTAKWQTSGSITAAYDNHISLVSGVESKDYTLIAGTQAKSTLNASTTTDTGVDISIKGTEGWGNDFSKSYTLKERIQTGSDTYHVGAMGDVYIGRNINWVYSPSDYIMLKETPSASGKFSVVSESGHHYLLTKWEDIARYSKDSTSFRISQYEIINTQIPDLVKKRNALTTFVDALPDPNSVEKIDGKFQAFALKSVEKSEYWKNGEFITIEPAQVSKGYVEDMVTHFNSAIGQWQSLISSVEEKKYKTFADRKQETFTEWSNSTNIKYGFIDNYSFDAGTQLSRNFTSTESTTGTQTTSVSTSAAYTWEMKVKNESGIVLNTSTKTKKGGSVDIKRVGSDTESRSSTFGYTLSDNNIGDHFSVDVYMPGSVVVQKTTNNTIAEGSNTIFMPEPFMFCTRAGLSRTPYEKPQMSLYYKENEKSVPLDDGTVSLDEPYLKFEKRDILNVPSGTAASVKFTVANNSSAVSGAKSFSYSFKNKNKDNTNGLEIYVDGQPVAEGISFSLSPGTKIERTMTLKQTRLDITDYKNLVFELSLGESAADTINVSFSPQAPAIKMTSNDGYLVNSASKSQRLMFKLGGYSSDYYAFTGVRLQYKRQAEQTWHTQRILINDAKRYEELSGELPQGWRQLNAEDTCYIDFADMAEGTYLVRAQSFSLVGPQQELTSETEPLTIVKDTKAPQVMGAPQPSTGYYSSGSEISVTFNEPINIAAVSDDNFYVTAELNDAEVTHNTGLHFDGNTPACTSSRVDIFGQSTTLAFWYKPQVGKTSCLFSQTLKPNSADSIPVKLFYNDDATLSMQFGKYTTKSSRKALGADGKAEQDWMYAILQFDEAKRTVNVYNLSGTSNEAQSSFISNEVYGLDNFAVCNVPLYIGGSKAGDNCYADIEGFIVYEGLKTFADAAKDKSNKRNANLRGLLAYWPMDEGYGKTAKDRVRSRNLSLSGTDNWYMPVQNYALRLNGKGQYVMLNTSGCPVAKNEDYVVEMMFRTADTKHDGVATLFSNGWGGIGTTELSKDVPSRLSLSLDENGRVVLAAAGTTYAPMGKDYRDNQWHHIALCVNRDGYATVLVDTVDVSNNELIAGSDLGSFSNAKMALGALVYKDSTSTALDNTVVGQYFAGDIDEVRIWNAHRTIANVRSSIDSRLNGNEPGLVAYYPFERTDLVANQQKTTPTVSDRTVANDNTGFVPAVDPELHGFNSVAADQLAEEATTDQGARIKAAAFKSRLDIDWVCSQIDRNKIVLSFPSELSKARIEGCVVNFTVRDIFDDNENRMAQPETWSVYVTQQALRAFMFDDEFKQEIGTNASSELSIYNYSASTQNWKLGNVPSWLKVSATEGTLSPNESVALTVTTDEGQGIGSYQDVLVLTDSEGLQTLLPVSLTVTGNRPDWKVDVESQEWMAVMGRIKIADTWCNDENSLVAAFDSEGKCHGVASPAYDSSMDTYFVHLNLVGSMPANDKNLTFKVWDAGTGLVYSNVNFTESKLGTVGKLPFTDMKVLGSFAYPCVFATDNITHQELSLKTGWNWVSLWVDPEDKSDYRSTFGKGNGVVADVKRQYPTDPNKKPVVRLDLDQSYHVYASTDGILDVSGSIIDPEKYEIYFPCDPDEENTWTWLGYPIGTRMTLNEAFADFQPAENDIVKSQREYAMYNGKAWVGTLKYLSPGEGYIYGYHGRIGDGVRWHYPKMQDIARTPMAVAVATTEGIDRFKSNPCRYAGNASVLANLTLDGKPAAGMQIAAFVDGECRGWTTADSTGTAYLTIGGDVAGENVRYRMSDPSTGAVTAVRGQDSYAVNAIIGNLAEPRELRAESASHFELDVTPSAYEDYTYLTATVLDEDGTPYAHDYELAAFSESGECRGVSACEAGKAAEIAIYGSEGETFHFRLFDLETMEEQNLIGSQRYDAYTPCLTTTLRVGTDGINGIGVDADENGRWYSVPGMLHNGKPSQTGVYIKGHRKSAVVRK